METNFSIIKAPCNKEMIKQMVKVEQVSLAGSYPFAHLNRSLLASTEEASSLNLEWHNMDPNTVFATAHDSSKMMGYAMAFKVCSSRAPGFLRGIGAYDMCGAEYLYLSAVAVHPYYQKKGVGTKLIEQIISTQTCKKVLLWTKNDSEISRLIIKLGGEVADRTYGGYYMTLPIRK